MNKVLFFIKGQESSQLLDTSTSIHFKNSRLGASEYFSDDPLSENFGVTLVLFIKVMLPFDPRSLWLSRNSG